jgi:3-hydroxybutyryl-CoA dehydrogenase
MIDPHSDNLHLGVIGAGAMGQGIVQVAISGGIAVSVYDAKDGAAEAGLATVAQRLDRLVEKKRMTPHQAAAARARARAITGLEGMAGCHVIIEAVFEDLELKQGIFQQLEAIVSDDCILASNTSSLLIASIARNCTRKARIAGMHFFNPVPLMRLVEIVQSADTTDETVAFLTALAERMTRTPVTVRDAPGFLVNHGGRAYTTEAMRILHERVATPAQIDAVMRDCGHFRMGPLELADLTGMDVNYPVSLFVYNGYDQDPRLKTSFPHRALLEAGRLGRKTGHGNFRYDEAGRRIENEDGEFTTTAAPATQVYLVEPDAALIDFAAAIGCKILSNDDGTCPLLAAPLGEDATSLAVRTGCDTGRLVCVDLHCDTSRRVTLMTAPGARIDRRDAVAASVLRSGRAATAINDSPGFISQRIRAMVANLGCEMAQIGIAEPKQIDLAMRLGLNYPLGPLELAEDIGLSDTMTILERIQAITGDDRYRPSLWLKRRAKLNLPVYTPG